MRLYVTARQFLFCCARIRKLVIQFQLMLALPPPHTTVVRSLAFCCCRNLFEKGEEVNITQLGAPHFIRARTVQLLFGRRRLLHPRSTDLLVRSVQVTSL